MSLMGREKKAWERLRKVEKENIAEIKKLLRFWKKRKRKLHHCDYRMLRVEWDEYRLLYGVAVVECNESVDGWLVVDNAEYGNRVNYCPFCGYKAIIQMKLSRKVKKR